MSTSVTTEQSRGWFARKGARAAQIVRTSCDMLIDGRPRSRAALLITYLRLHLTTGALWLVRKSKHHEAVLGYRFEFTSYGLFAFLFEEVFIEQDYFFVTNNPTPRIIDCGSNIGVSICYFRWLYPRARVVAFEPARAVFALLRTNMLANGFTDVALHNYALSDVPGPLMFHTNVDVCGSLVDGRTDNATEGLETVNGVLLSEYIDGEIDFLKMDIEGAELNVLREVAAAGKLELIRRLVIEYHHHIDPMADRLSEVLGLLERHGFSYQLKAKRLHVEDPGAFQDIIIACTRRDLMTRTGQLT